MKNYLTLMLLTIFLLPAVAQKKNNQKSNASVKTETPVPAEVPNQKTTDVQQPSQRAVDPFINHFLIKYQVAIQFGDNDVARDALYDLIIENPKNDSLFLQLGFLYFESQKFASAILVGQELLARNSKNPSALELTGSAYEALNLNDKALQSFETLYLITNSFPALYKMAFLQFAVKRFAEAQATTDILLSKKEADELVAPVTTIDNKSKDYPLRVSILNLKGMIARDSGDKASARKNFEQVLAIAPDSKDAKEALSMLK